ncbi:MAG: extracellular solute-binding protein, partial [Candidatus Hydrogenedentales bacterium]
YSRDEVPHTWDELLEPQWDQKITIRKPPESGTMRTFIGGMILREGGVEAGLEWLRKLHEATRSYLETPQLLFDHLKRNEDLITVWIMPDAVLQRDRHGYPFDFVLPPDTPVLTEGIAIVKDAPHRESAELFYEFVTTQEALAHQAETYGKIPARDDVPEDALPAWMVEQPIDAMEIDWQEFSQQLPEWVRRWEQEVYAAP